MIGGGQGPFGLVGLELHPKEVVHHQTDRKRNVKKYRHLVPRHSHVAGEDDQQRPCLHQDVPEQLQQRIQRYPAP